MDRARPHQHESLLAVCVLIVWREQRVNVEEGGPRFFETNAVLASVLDVLELVPFKAKLAHTDPCQFRATVCAGAEGLYRRLQGTAPEGVNRVGRGVRAAADAISAVTIALLRAHLQHLALVRRDISERRERIGARGIGGGERDRAAALYELRDERAQG